MKKFAKILSFLAMAFVAIAAYAADIVVVSIDGDDVTVAGEPTAPGAVIQPGATVKTGENTKITVKSPDGSTLTIDESSEVQLTAFEEDDNGKTHITIEVKSGAVSATMSLPRGSSFTIKTSEGTVTGRSGTVYVSSSDGSTTVTSTSGSVRVTNSDGSNVVVGAGQSSTIGGDTGTSSHVATAGELAAANALADAVAEPTASAEATSALTGDVQIEGADTQVHVEEDAAPVNSPALG